MARTNMDAWIPIEKGSTAFTAIQTGSALEAVGRPEPMASDTKEVPRSNGVDVGVVGKGAAYGEDGGTDDVVTLRARKFASAVRIADEDLADAPANVIAIKQTEWANGYAAVLDNAAFGTTAAMNGTTVPFESVYYTIATADADLGYTAGANRIQTAGALTYADLSSAFSLVENGDYFGDLVVVASPAFRGELRGLVDNNGRPVFLENMAGAQAETLFGVPMVWSRGARTSATATRNPTGNPLLIVANRNALIRGDRLAPETTVLPGWANNLTDETLLKGRARKGFALAHPNAAAVVEITVGV